MKYQPIVVPGGDYYHTPTPPQYQPLTFDPNRGFRGGNTYTGEGSNVGDYYNNSVPANFNVPQVPTTPIGNATGYVPTPTFSAATGMQTYAAPTPTLRGAPQGALGSLGGALSNVGNNFKNMVGLGGDSFDQMWNGTKSAVGTAGANAGTAWGKMGYGERGTALLGAATGLYGAYNAHKTNKLAREQFNFTKDSFNRNFEAQAKTTNAQLADRQNARHTRNPNAHASVSDYMKKYGV